MTKNRNTYLLIVIHIAHRVIMFQSRFDDLWRRFEMYSNGEKLFGLVVNDYPILHQKKKEFNLLSKLYSLYLAVMNSIDGYFQTPWGEINIEQIIAQLSEFDIRYILLCS